MVTAFRCKPGVSGVHCEIVTQQCPEANPCLNHGECTEKDGQVSCSCEPGIISIFFNK